MVAINFLKWTKLRYKKKSFFIISMSLPIIIFITFFFCCDRTGVLIKRGDVVRPSPTGNFTIVLWNGSSKTPYAKILVEIRNTISLRRLYYGVMPYPDQFPEETGGHFDGHYREHYSYDLPAGSYDVIVHELKTKTAAVLTVNIPREGEWILYINFDNYTIFDNYTMDILSPYPHFSFVQGTEAIGIL